MGTENDSDSQDTFNDGDAAERRTISFDSEREKLLCEWRGRWLEIRGLGEFKSDNDEPLEGDAIQWAAAHVKEVVALPDSPFFETMECAIYLQPKPGHTFTPPNATWKRFAEFSDRLLLKLKRGIGAHVGTPLPQIVKVPQTFLLDGIITTSDTVLVYGGEKEGKSAWAHRLAIAIASDDGDFDGIPIKHGRVLYISLDSGARKAQVAIRMQSICNRLGIEQPENLIVVHDQVFLDDEMSVASLLRYNPGEFVLVIVDPLFRALSGGDPSHAGAVNASIENLIRIQEQTGAAVMILNHDTKTGGMYGSKFWGANADCKIFIERNFKTNRVTLKVELSKNTDALELPPIHYQLEKEYLAAIDAPDSKMSVSAMPYADMLPLIPTTATLIRDARKLIEHLLVGSPATREKQWQRIRAAWIAAGAVEQTATTIRRLVESAS